MYYYKNTKIKKRNRKRGLGECENVKTRSKRCEAKNCLSSDVNLCLPDSVESKATRGSKVNPYSFFIKNNTDTHTVR